MYVKNGYRNYVIYHSKLRCSLLIQKKSTFLKFITWTIPMNPFPVSVAVAVSVVVAVAVAVDIAVTVVVAVSVSVAVTVAVSVAVTWLERSLVHL